MTFGIQHGDYRAVNIREDGNHTSFQMTGLGRTHQCRMQLAGLHNVKNALAALVASWEIGVEAETAVTALATFRGVSRRFEVKGEAGGVLVSDTINLTIDVEAIKQA